MRRGDGGRPALLPECGARRGDPRLPFMDAVVLMEAVRQSRQPPPPPPPTAKRRGITPNAALIAGVGALLLALGIGVLIGRSGNHEAAQSAAAPQVIKVGGGGGGSDRLDRPKGKSTRRRDGLKAKTKSRSRPR